MFSLSREMGEAKRVGQIPKKEVGTLSCLQSPFSSLVPFCQLVEGAGEAPTKS